MILKNEVPCASAQRILFDSRAPFFSHLTYISMHADFIRNERVICSRRISQRRRTRKNAKRFHLACPWTFPWHDAAAAAKETPETQHRRRLDVLINHYRITGNDLTLNSIRKLNDPYRLSPVDWDVQLVNGNRCIYVCVCAIVLQSEQNLTLCLVTSSLNRGRDCSSNGANVNSICDEILHTVSCFISVFLHS